MMGREEKYPLSKERIIYLAQKGVFDRSPLIGTVHVVTCPNCRRKRSVVLLEYLRTGEFEVGKVEQIEVTSTEGLIAFVESEIFTPIIVRQTCKTCSSQYEVRLISAEYLKQIIDRPETSKSMYA